MNNIFTLRLEPYKGTRIDRCLDKAQRIATLLGVSVSFLFNDEDRTVYPETNQNPATAQPLAEAEDAIYTAKLAIAEYTSGHRTQQETWERVCDAFAGYGYTRTAPAAPLADKKLNREVFREMVEAAPSTPAAAGWSGEAWRIRNAFLDERDAIIKYAEELAKSHEIERTTGGDLVRNYHGGAMRAATDIANFIRDRPRPIPHPDAAATPACHMPECQRCTGIGCLYCKGTGYDAAATPGVYDGVAMIDTERTRQIRQEGWTAEHDDKHSKCEMAKAAEAYIRYATYRATQKTHYRFMPKCWPEEWDGKWWKPAHDPIRNLVKAGALIAAEIDRLQRASQPLPDGGEGVK